MFPYTFSHMTFSEKSHVISVQIAFKIHEKKNKKKKTNQMTKSKNKFWLNVIY